MPRQIISPDTGSELSGIQGEVRGGTGASTAEQALINLNGIGLNTINRPNGVLGLDSSGSIPKNAFETVGVDGDLMTLAGQWKEWFITTYDSLSTYQIEAIGGQIEVNEHIIRYRASGEVKPAGFIINGRRITIEVIGDPVVDPEEPPPVTIVIQQPQIVAPANDSQTVNPKGTIYSSLFAAAQGEDVHFSTDWEISTVPNFESVLVSNIGSRTDLTSFTPSSLNYAKQYYVRVRHRGASGTISAWSTTVAFRTKDRDLPVTEIKKVLASDGAASDQFGLTVNISNDGLTAIATSFGDDSYTGSAYVFVKSGNTWIQQAKLVSNDRASGDQFGWSCSLSADGNIAMIGAHAKSSSRGAVYVFTRTGTSWTQTAKLTASDAVSNDQFGYSVYLSADASSAIIGARGFSSNRGAVYVFTRSGTTWTQQTKITASDGASNDYFGQSMFLLSDGNTAFIGARGDDSGRGSVYVFTRSGNSWAQQTKLVSSDRAVEDYFGSVISVSKDGSILLIGAYYDDDRGSNSGSVYYFTRSGNTWIQQSKLNASDGAAVDVFGCSISMSDDGTVALIGAQGDDDRGTDSGSIYVFTRDENVWSQQTKLIASDGAASDQFGLMVFISGDGSTAITGAFNNDDRGSNSGAAYFFGS
jgi:hypothetical protein